MASGAAVYGRRERVLNLRSRQRFGCPHRNRTRRKQAGEHLKLAGALSALGKTRSPLAYSQ